jgi:integrase/recombinase XerD
LRGAATRSRARAILETFYSTDIRRLELINLTLFDVDASRGTLSIRQGKGGKDRFVPIGDAALAWVEKYQWDARPRLVKGHDDETLFLSSLGEKITTHPAADPPGGLGAGAKRARTRAASMPPGSSRR